MVCRWLRFREVELCKVERWCKLLLKWVKSEFCANCDYKEV